MRYLRRSNRAGWVALLAMLLQLCLGQPAMAMPVAAAADAQLSGTQLLGAHICIPGQDAPARHMPHQGLDCQQCPLCAGLAAAALLPAPPFVPAPKAHATPTHLARATPSAPRDPRRLASPPRGPPVLS